MPVVTRNSNLIRPTNAVADFNPGSAQFGVLHTLVGQVSVALDDFSGSIYTLGHIPSNARMARGGFLRWSNLGAGCTGRMRFGATAAAPSGVLNSGVEALTFSAANVAEPLTNHGDAQLSQELWQLCGLAADPRNMIAATIELTANAAANGNIGFYFLFSLPK